MSDVVPFACSPDLAGGHLRTECLTVCELADYFGLGRRKMAAVLKAMQGVERIGSRYRLRLEDMPPRYLIERGLLRSA